MQDNLKDKPLLDGINFCHVMFYMLFFDKPYLPYQSMIDFYHAKFIPLLEEARKIFPIKGSDADIKELLDQTMTNFIFKTEFIVGIEYSKYKVCFDFSNVCNEKIPKDLPDHGLIAIRNNKITCYTEENTLFGIAITNYQKALKYDKYFHEKVKPVIEKPNGVAEGYAQNIRIFTGIYLINATLLIHNFLECFINSLAFQKKVNFEETRKKHRSIFYKKCLVIVNLYILTRISDMNEINQKDFESFYKSKETLYQCIQNRNSLVHYEKYNENKKEIVTNVNEWLERAKSSVETCIDEAKQIWFDCTGSTEIFYLYNLDLENKILNYQIFKEFEFNKELFEEMLKTDYPEEQKKEELNDQIWKND